MSEPLSSSVIGSGTISAKTVDDITDLFKELDNEKDDTSIKKEKAPRGEETDEGSEDENKEIKESSDGDIELIEPDEEEEKIDLLKPDDEDINIDAPPRKAEILKKFPELFKDFPFIEKALYRDKQYSELFGSFDDAKEIAEKADVFNAFESQLMAGDTIEILKNVKEADPKAFDKIVDNYMINLSKADKDAYFEVIGNINRHLIMEMVKEGNESNNDDLKQAALMLNQFLFGTSKFTAPKPRSSEVKNDEKSEAEAERLTWVQERYETTRDELQVRVDNTLRSTISQYIDPKSQMTAYIKKNAVNDALKILNTTLRNDSGLKTNLDRLWRQAFDSKFNKDSVGKIQSHYLGRAKGYLKTAIMKARAEALKDITPSTRRKEDAEDSQDEREKETPPKRGQISGGRPTGSTSKNEMRKGESVAEFFARD